jgi:hypothetical protein
MSDAPKRVGPLRTELMSQMPELPPPSEDGAPPVPGGSARWCVRADATRAGRALVAAFALSA